MAAAETLLKTGEISAMIKQGYISSPPPPPFSSSSSSPPTATPKPTTTTLFQMISQQPQPNPSAADHRRIRIQDRLHRFLPAPGSDWGPPDVDLTVASPDGLQIRFGVHRRVLAARSRFFADRLGGRRAGGGSSVVEISECDDVEVYADVVSLMYCGDLRRRLAGEEVGRVLGILKVSAAIMFDAGVSACLEYLEAVPWSEDEEEEVKSVLEQFKLREPVPEVLQRVLVEPSSSSRADAIFLQLLSGILQAKDEKARRDMKALIFGLLSVDTSHNKDNVDKLEVSRETLYHLCHKCLSSLHLCLSEAAITGDSQRTKGDLVGEISRESDNLKWLVKILINKEMSDEFVMLWADQTELANLHSKIPCMYRFKISEITADLCIAVGRGHILVSKDARFSFLRTWLEALYDDFGWMKRTCRTFDKKTLEEGLCNTILTLSMAQQQDILLRWFDRFLKKGDDCPNIQRAFEVWWRRAFIRRYEGNHDQAQLQIAVCEYPTSRHCKYCDNQMFTLETEELTVGYLWFLGYNWLQCYTCDRTLIVSRLFRLKEL
ncbi:BTB/POZ domain-containing protein [Iris pallida]|uniref:BTB/POZ domain-containing protein n=1 Tax=Iris pallida TaxID=29817 RepID=A0AAX6DK50_IRIPA|nr:BTB/POZ domain-containing protein [Iris pallida]